MRVFGGVLLVLTATVCGAAEPAGNSARHDVGKNRLGDETSPYLRLHADNPVHWYAWGDDAFEAAKRQKKPIFLSIGYSSCHWCHVMNRESFADPKIAAILNEHFICIKVDREERPDVDQLYMNAVQAITGQGGWPLSAFLLEDGRPFFGGTYFPPEDREVEGGVMVGFPKVLQSVLDALKDKRDEIEQQATGLSDYLRHQATAVILNPAPITKEIVAEAIQGISKRVDPVHAGFSSPPDFAPKFPQPSMGLLLVDYSATRNEKELLKPVAHQLTTMARGGIYDQVGGGFHRYSVDREWVVPHFEKMLYDQAQLLSLYSRMYTLEKDPLYERIVRETVAFLQREMMAPEKLFYSALDADSEHEEGKFYVWTTDELQQVLGEDYPWVAELTGVTEGPNFEGKHILVMNQNLADAARTRGVTEEQLIIQWNAAKAKLLAARSQRVRPLLDTKVITGWNALTVVGLADSAQTFNDDAFRELALESANQMLRLLRKEDGSLVRHWIAGQAKGDAFADDYAATALALLAAHRLEPSDHFLAAAQQLVDFMIENFAAPRGKGFFYTGKHQENLVAPVKDSYDGATPSANSMAALALVQLAKAMGQDKYRERALGTFEAFSNDLNSAPAGSTVMVRALNLYFQTGDAAVVSDSSMKAKPAATPDQPIAAITILPKAIKAAAGQKVTVQVQIELNDPWHINGNPAFPDYLQPTTLKLADTGVVASAEFQYPKAQALELAGFDEPIQAYQGKVTLTAQLQIAEGAPAGEHELNFELRYQPCDDKRCLAPTRKTIPFVIAVTPK